MRSPATVGFTATVQDGSIVPADVVSTGTTKWNEAAWSDEDGWPVTVAFFQERLVFAKEQTVDFSQTGDFENFEPTDDSNDVTTANPPIRLGECHQ